VGADSSKDCVAGLNVGGAEERIVPLSVGHSKMRVGGSSRLRWHHNGAFARACKPLGP
jgi:hypothetical protein